MAAPTGLLFFRLQAYSWAAIHLAHLAQNLTSTASKFGFLAIFPNSAKVSLKSAERAVTRAWQTAAEPRRQHNRKFEALHQKYKFTAVARFADLPRYSRLVLDYFALFL